jgi:hypothetical protein
VGIRAKYYSVDQIKNNEIGRACGTQGRQERYIQGVGGEGKSPLGRTSIILKLFFKNWDAGHELD